MKTADQLLRAAERMMGKGGSRAKGAWARGAALLTSQAIEASLAGLWSQHGPARETLRPHPAHLPARSRAG